jgi:hypothetical protein
MGRSSRRKKGSGPRGPVGDPPAPSTTRDRVRDTAVANAYAAVERTWDASRSEGATEDGSDTDPERGPETERVIAGERVRTVLDRVMGGIAVSVVRTQKEELGDMVWFLGRLWPEETHASILGHEMRTRLNPDVPVKPDVTVVDGVWRNDRNGWVTELVTALTEEAAIEQMVLAFLRQHPASMAGTSSSRALPRKKSTKSHGGAKKSKSRKPLRSVVNMDIGPDEIFQTIVMAADSVLTRSKIAPLSNLAARTIGSLTVAKLLLRLGGEPARGVMDSLEEFSDALASRFFTEMIAGGGESLEVPGGPPVYPRLVTNLANRTGNWCPATIDPEEPSPFPPSFALDGVPKLGHDVTWRIVRDLARVRATIHAGGTARQQQHYVIGETVALMAVAKLHLAIWGNGKMSAGFEFLADQRDPETSVQFQRFRPGVP